MIQNLSFWVISPVLNLILCDFCQPEVVFLGIRIENIHSYVRFTHFLNNRSICTVSHINSTILSWIASDQGFSSFEGMNMILKGCHYVIFVELWNPMEKSVQETSWISIESFTYTVNWHMVVDKLDFIFVGFKRVDHKFFLVSKIRIILPIKSMHVSRIKCQVMDVTEGEVEHGSSLGQWRDFFNDVTVEISLIMLGEVNVESGAFVGDCDVNTRKLI